MEPFTIHRVAWTREKSQRFWSYFGSKPADEVGYWSREFGRGLLDSLAASGIRPGAKVLDFGCGHGHLLKHLADRGLSASGIDFSPDNVRHANELTASNPRVLGASLVTSIPTSLDAGVFDTVFLVETMEHLLNPDLDATIGEIHRVLRPGGTAIITVPNDENLAVAETVCPDCGGVFHPVQHVRSWSKTSLERYMWQAGFKTRLLRAWLLQRTRSKTVIATLGSRLLGQRLPHLVYAGEKL